MIYKVIISESYSVGIEADGFNANQENGNVTFRKYTKSDKSSWENIAIFKLANIIGFFVEKGDNEE